MLKNCWEIKKCERQTNGSKTKELGICIAAAEKLGHSCWTIAGTLCGGKIQGTYAEKEKNCMSCEVYKLYSRAAGTEGKKILLEHPEEEKKYQELMKNRLAKKQ